MRNRIDETGFTLLELLVAMTITALIVVLISSGLSLTIRAWEKGRDRTMADQRARIILTKMSKEISSLYPYKYVKEEGQESGEDQPLATPNLNTGKKVLAVKGDPDRFDFISTLDPTDPEEVTGGLKMVSLRLDAGGANRGASVVVEEKRFNPGAPLGAAGGEGEIFSEGVQDLKFRYFVVKMMKDLAGKESPMPGQWQSLYIDEVEPAWVESFDKTVLRGVEVTLSLYEAGNDGEADIETVVEYPPLIIPLNSGRDIKALEN